jgi:hypothetical protein
MLKVHGVASGSTERKYASNMRKKQSNYIFAIIKP